MNANSDLCMSIPGDVLYVGQVINQWTCGGYPDQSWYQEPSASNPGWYYLQPAQNNRLCVTYVPQSDAQLTLQDCGVNAANGNTNTQLWQINLTNAHADYGNVFTRQGWAMSIPGASTATGAKVNTWPFGNYVDQSWWTSLTP